jgi:predicted MFS family arabinose efflux permease
MSSKTRLFLLGCGAAALMVAMGIGRFAFTPILPEMQRANGFSDATAGMMASLNLLGYLAGALSAGRMRVDARPMAFRASLVLAVLAIGLMAAPLGAVGWSLVRLLAGLSSGMIFVLSTAFILESGAAQGRHGTAVHFAGVGLGIALSGVVVQIEPHWQSAWLILGGLAALLSVAAWTLPRHPPAPVVRTVAATTSRHTSRLMRILTAAYSLEGLGYIVSGTFLVSVLRRLPETSGLGPLAWVVVGLAAAPSTLLWSILARRFGLWAALSAAYLLQAVGVALPLAGAATAALVSATLFGGTFAAITGLSLSLGASLQPEQPGRAAARLTVLYGIGQVIGPLLAGLATGGGGDFTRPLAGAAMVITAAAALSVVGHRLHRRGADQCPTSTSRSPAKAPPQSKKAA